MINLRSVICLGIVVAACPPIFASINASDLLANSPFVHARIVQGNAGAGGASAQQYDFRGICKMNGSILVNISDNAKKKTYWIKSGDTEGDIKVVGYDEESRKVSLLVGSRDYSLELSKPKSLVANSNVNPNIDRQTRDKSDRDAFPLRIKRIKRPGMVPPRPPSINFNNPNFQNSSKARRNVINGASGGAPFLNQAQNNSTPDSNSNTSTNNSSERDANSFAAETDAGTNDAPPNTIPGNPPSFIPEMPEGLKAKIESGAAPAGDNSLN